MAPPAPPLLSTYTDWPSAADNFSATRRAATSVEPPGGNGTKARTGRLGQAWACAGSRWSDNAIARATARRIGIRGSPWSQSALFPGPRLERSDGPAPGPQVLAPLVDRPGLH